MLLPGLPTQYPACVRLLCSAPAYAAWAVRQRRPASAVSALERRAAEITPASRAGGRADGLSEPGGRTLAALSPKPLSGLLMLPHTLPPPEGHATNPEKTWITS